MSPSEVGNSLELPVPQQESGKDPAFHTFKVQIPAFLCKLRNCFLPRFPYRSSGNQTSHRVVLLFHVKPLEQGLTHSL